MNFENIITTIKHHNLNYFWNLVKTIILKIQPKISQEQIKRLENIINDFIYIDKQSTRFRYPFDDSGDFVFSGKKHFSFLPAQSVKTMERMKKLFDYILDIMFSNVN